MLSLLMSTTGFIPHIEQLFNEDVLIGTGWSARETLRPLAYGTLTDFAHHVRGQLSLSQVKIFSRLSYTAHVCRVLNCSSILVKNLVNANVKVVW